MADLKYYDGANWITLKGAGVDLTQSVDVNTTDCDIGPADSTGSLTKDGAEVDGVQTYKLDLTLPRPPVVTTSEGEPVDACDGDFWVDSKENEILPEDEYRTLWGTWDGTFGTGEATEENGKLKSEGISSVAYISLGTYDINFEKEFPSPDYCWVGQAGMNAMTTPTATLAGLRTGAVKTNKLTVYSNYINTNNNALYNYENISVIIFDRIPAQ